MQEMVIIDWFTEIKVLYDNEILLQQVIDLKRVQEKLRHVVDEDEEMDVKGIFISNIDLETMKSKLRHTRNLIWQGIKERIHNVLMRPWEASFVQTRNTK